MPASHEYFNLDREKLKLVADALLGYSECLGRSHEAVSSLRAQAGMTLRAASYLALVDVGQARAAFRLACIIFAKINSSYAPYLAICAGEPGMALEYTPRISRVGHSLGEQSPADAVSRLLTDSWLRSDRGSAGQIESHEEDLGRFNPVGRLGVPFYLYAEAFSRRERYSGTRRLARWQDAVVALVGRMCEPVERTMRNSYSWQTLCTPLLPVEPEALATFIALQKFDPRSRGLARLMKGRVPPMAVHLLQLASGFERDRLRSTATRPPTGDFAGVTEREDLRIRYPWTEQTKGDESLQFLARKLESVLETRGIHCDFIEKSQARQYVSDPRFMTVQVQPRKKRLKVTVYGDLERIAGPYGRLFEKLSRSSAYFFIDETADFTAVADVLQRAYELKTGDRDELI